MSYQVISSFQGGLDARKFFLSLPPGTLTTLVNGHITQGGEIEKRKLFLPWLLPNGTFGAQETTDGIVIFGSSTYTAWSGGQTLISGTGNSAIVTLSVAPGGTWIPAPGDPITVSGSLDPNVNGNFVVQSFSGGAGGGVLTYLLPNGTPYFNVESTVITPIFPADVIYQQLTYPVSGVTLTDIVSSTYFDGVVQAVTKWSNGDTQVYSGSAIEGDFYVGSQNPITPTPIAIADSLVDAAVASGHYTGIKPVVPAFLYIQITAGTSSPGVNVVGTTGMSYSFGRSVSLNNLSTSGVDTGTAFTLFTTPVDWNTSNNQTASDVVSAINATNVYGFTASIGTSPNIVEVIPPATDANGNPLAVTATDMLLVIAGGNVQIFIPPNVASFDILSIPDEASPNPFTVGTTVVNGALPFKLVSNGVASTLPTSAAGQFAIIAGLTNAQGTGTLTISGTGPLNNETVTIGSTVYTFVTILQNVVNQILLGSSIDATLGNLVVAINGAAGAGTAYSSPTQPNTQVSAAAVVAHATVVTAIVNGTPGNIAVSEAATNLAWSGLTAGHLTGGTDTNQVTQISVGAVNLLASEVPFNTSVNQTAADVVAGINAFQGTSGFTATANLNVITVLAIAGGTSTNNDVVSVACAGGVCIANCLALVTGVSGGSISSITINGGTNILNGGTAITFQGSGHAGETIATFCERVVTSVNLNSASSHYVAASTGANIFLSSATVTSADPLATVVYTSTNIFLNAATGTTILAVGNTASITFVKKGTTEKSVNSPNSALVSASGGTPPYTYRWTNVGGSINAAPQLIGLSNQWWTVSKTGSQFALQFPVGTEIWQCQVFDAVGASALVQFILTYS